MSGESRPLTRPAGAVTAAPPPPPSVVIEPTSGLAGLQLGALWSYRELLYFLVWRDIKVRYKQTALGVAWIVLQPLVTMVIFSLLFGGLLQVPSDGAPYPVFAYAGLLPWNYFAGALTRASQSLVGSAHLITKVYFPRMLIPLSGVTAGLVDFGVALVVLIGLMAYYRLAPTAAIALILPLLLLALITALGFGLWLGALNVRYRDVNYLVPFLVQTWMYVTPVIYPATIIPERFRWLLALNPMSGVVHGFRQALLGPYLEQAPPWNPLHFWLSVVVALLVLVSGAYFFRATERTFADIV
jgi:lipopolysaccharide transport system permease protein